MTLALPLLFGPAICAVARGPLRCVRLRDLGNPNRALFRRHAGRVCASRIRPDRRRIRVGGYAGHTARTGTGAGIRPEPRCLGSMDVCRRPRLGYWTSIPWPPPSPNVTGRTTPAPFSASPYPQRPFPKTRPRRSSEPCKPTPAVAGPNTIGMRKRRLELTRIVGFCAGWTCLAAGLLVVNPIGGMSVSVVSAVTVGFMGSAGIVRIASHSPRPTAAVST